MDTGCGIYTYIIGPHTTRRTKCTYVRHDIELTRPMPASPLLLARSRRTMLARDRRRRRCDSSTAGHRRRRRESSRRLLADDDLLFEQSLHHVDFGEGGRHPC